MVIIGYDSRYGTETGGAKKSLFRVIFIHAQYSKASRHDDVPVMV